MLESQTPSRASLSRQILHAKLPTIHHFYCSFTMWTYVALAIVQPRPLWPASDNRESIFNVRLTTSTPISYSTYWINRCFVPFLAENNSSLNALHDLFWCYFIAPVICTNIVNDGCTALYCTCIYRYCASPIFLLWSTLFAWLQSSDNHGLDNWSWTIVSNQPL